MSNHTPGPWTLEANGACWNLRSPDRDKHFLMLVGMTRNNPGELEANVRLISSATKLLAACKEAVAMDDNWCCNSDPLLAPIVRDRMVAAIAEAEGEKR